MKCVEITGKGKKSGGKIYSGAFNDNSFFGQRA